MSEKKNKTDIEDKVKDILNEHQNLEISRKKKLAQIKIKKEKRKRIITYSRRIILFLMACTAAYLYFADHRATSLRDESQVWFSGFLRDDDYRLRECILNLWEIRRYSDTFYADRGQFPENLSELTAEEPALMEISCPASGKKYIDKISGEQKIIACPTPEFHGIYRAWIDLKTGPPRIERR